MTEKGRILIVEDDKNLGDTLLEYLTGLGYSCHLARDGQSATHLFSLHAPQILLMDIGLPDTDGLSLSLELRKKRKDFKLLFLSAQNDPEMRVHGLEIGAEDYISKPFALKELVLRLQRILRNEEHLSGWRDPIVIGSLCISFKSFELRDASGKSIPLSQRECGILQMLYSKKNQAVRREELLEQLWGEDHYPSNRTIDNYMVKLRKWCETDPAKSVQIDSVRGIGYKFVTR